MSGRELLIAAPQLYYKTTRADGKDWRTRRYDYAQALETGEVTRHPTSTVINPADHSTFIHIATTPSDTLSNGFVQARLFQVKPVGRVKRLTCQKCQTVNQNWRAALAFKVVKELPIAEAFGPNGALVMQFFALIAHALKEFFWALARNYESPTPEGIGIKIRDATKNTDVFGVALTARIHIVGAAMHHAPKTMPDDIKTDAAQAFSDTGWGTRGLIPAEFTDVCMRTWRRTFNGDDYA